MINFVGADRRKTKKEIASEFAQVRTLLPINEPTQDNGKLPFTESKRVDQPLEDRARETLKYAQDYANKARSVFAPAVASTQAEFHRLLFRQAHQHVKHILGMTDVAA